MESLKSRSEKLKTHKAFGDILSRDYGLKNGVYRQKSWHRWKLLTSAFPKRLEILAQIAMALIHDHSLEGR